MIRKIIRIQNDFQSRAPWIRFLVLWEDFWDHQKRPRFPKNVESIRSVNYKENSAFPQMMFITPHVFHVVFGLQLTFSPNFPIGCRKEWLWFSFFCWIHDIWVKTHSHFEFECVQDRVPLWVALTPWNSAFPKYSLAKLFFKRSLCLENTSLTICFLELIERCNNARTIRSTRMETGDWTRHLKNLIYFNFYFFFRTTNQKQKHQLFLLHNNRHGYWPQSQSEWILIRFW